MSSLHKKTKLNDDTPQVMLDGYIGHEDVPENVTHVRFHTSVTKIADCAFIGRSSLNAVVLNDGLREIGKSAFEYCTALQIINNIPSTVTKIGSFAFSECSSLNQIVLNEGLTEIGVRAFINCTKLQSITIPSSVLEISPSTFRGCTNLQDVVLNDGIEKIAMNTFEGCTSLERITIPSTVDNIEPWAFFRCTNLQDVVLNDGIKRIKTYAFIGCTSLEHITIPSSVLDIGDSSFKDCRRLREVVIQNNEEIQIGDTAYRGCTSLERFKFPSLSTRLNDIIQAGQRDLKAKMDDIPAVEWRDGELVIPGVRKEIEYPWGTDTVVKLDKEKLDKIVRLIRHYEIKEATTMFELALWKTRIDQVEDANGNRNAHCIEVPGPVKDTILQYLR